MSSEANKATVRAFYALLDQDQNAAVDRYAAPSITVEMSGMPPLDVEGFRAMGGQFFAAFPDLVHEVVDMVAEGDKVLIKLMVRGTHKAELMGVPASGATVAVLTMSLMQVVDGKIVSATILPDMMGLMTQIGAIPSPAVA